MWDSENFGERSFKTEQKKRSLGFNIIVLGTSLDWYAGVTFWMDFGLEC